MAGAPIDDQITQRLREIKQKQQTGAMATPDAHNPFADNLEVKKKRMFQRIKEALRNLFQ